MPLQGVQQPLHLATAHAPPATGQRVDHAVPGTHNSIDDPAPQALFLRTAQHPLGTAFRQIGQGFFHDEQPGSFVAARVSSIPAGDVADAAVSHPAHDLPELVEQQPALRRCQCRAQAMMHHVLMQPDLCGPFKAFQIRGHQPHGIRCRVIQAFNAVRLRSIGIAQVLR